MDIPIPVATHNDPTNKMDTSSGTDRPAQTGLHSYVTTVVEVIISLCSKAVPASTNV